MRKSNTNSKQLRVSKSKGREKKDIRSEQLEIWDKIDNPPQKEITQKNQDIDKKLGHQLSRYYAKIYELEKSIPKDFDSRNEYLNRKVLGIKSKMKSIWLGVRILSECKGTIENTALLAQDFSREISRFSKKAKFNSSQKRYFDNINRISDYLKENKTEQYQNAELLIQLTNNLVQLRVALSKTQKTRKVLSDYDKVIQNVLRNKVPF